MNYILPRQLHTPANLINQITTIYIDNFQTNRLIILMEHYPGIKSQQFDHPLQSQICISQNATPTCQPTETLWVLPYPPRTVNYVRIRRDLQQLGRCLCYIQLPHKSIDIEKNHLLSLDNYGDSDSTLFQLRALPKVHNIWNRRGSVGHIFVVKLYVSSSVSSEWRQSFLCEIKVCCIQKRGKEWTGRSAKVLHRFGFYVHLEKLDVRCWSQWGNVKVDGEGSEVSGWVCGPKEKLDRTAATQDKDQVSTTIQVGKINHWQ